MYIYLYIHLRLTMYSNVSLSVSQCIGFTGIGRKDDAQDLRDSDGQTIETLLVIYSHKKQSGRKMTMIIF